MRFYGDFPDSYMSEYTAFQVTLHPCFASAPSVYDQRFRVGNLPVQFLIGPFDWFPDPPCPELAYRVFIPGLGYNPDLVLYDPDWRWVYIDTEDVADVGIYDVEIQGHYIDFTGAPATFTLEVTAPDFSDIELSTSEEPIFFDNIPTDLKIKLGSFYSNRFPRINDEDGNEVTITILSPDLKTNIIKRNY